MTKAGDLQQQLYSATASGLGAARAWPRRTSELTSRWSFSATCKPKLSSARCRREVESVELLRRRIRQMAADEFCATTEAVVGRKVVGMLGDHNAVGNSSVLVFLLEPDRQ